MLFLYKRNRLFEKKIMLCAMFDFTQKGSDFEELHKQIAYLKLTEGTDYKREHLLFTYPDEYKYRFNKNNMPK